MRQSHTRKCGLDLPGHARTVTGCQAQEQCTTGIRRGPIFRPPWHQPITGPVAKLIQLPEQAAFKAPFYTVYQKPVQDQGALPSSTKPMPRFIKIPGMPWQGRRSPVAHRPNALSWADGAGILQHPLIACLVADQDAIRPTPRRQRHQPHKNLTGLDFGLMLLMWRGGPCTKGSRSRRPSPEPSPQQGRSNRMFNKQQSAAHNARNTE